MKYLNDYLKILATQGEGHPQNLRNPLPDPQDFDEPMVPHPQNLRNRPAEGDQDANGWTFSAGRWYAPGCFGLTTPFDQETHS